MRNVRVFSIVAAIMFAVGLSAQVISKPPQMPPRDPNQAPQQMPKGTASISGNVTSVQGGRPMRRATVRIQSATSPMSRTTTTDEKGNFEIKDAPAGTWNLVVWQEDKGLVKGNDGQPITIKPGETTTEKVEMKP